MHQLREWQNLGLIITTLLFLSGLALGDGADAPAKIMTMSNPVELSPTVLTKARDSYEKNCLRCHGVSGKGDGPSAEGMPIKPFDLTDTKQIAELTDGEIYWAITSGSEWMPAFGIKLTVRERWGLVRFVREISKTKPNTVVRRKN